MSNTTYMVALPCEPNKYGDNNLFSHAVREWSLQKKGIVANLAQVTKLNKSLITKAFMGKAVFASVAKKLAKALGYQVEQLFGVLPAQLPVNKRSSPTYLRIIMQSLSVSVSDHGHYERATG